MSKLEEQKLKEMLDTLYAENPKKIKKQEKNTKSNLAAKEPIKIEINNEFKLAFNTLENSQNNVFITGKAGTGKSTFLSYFRKHSKKNMVVLAPTGVAALNVKGQTIHSFFKIPPNITAEKVHEHKVSKKQEKLIQRLDMIIIDEASMLRADLLDCIDVALKGYMQNPSQAFGGVQMVFIGDLYQLPPVVASPEEREMFRTYYQSPYFFSAHIFRDFPIQSIEFQKIYRQNDDKFIDLLNKIRENTADPFDLMNLNLRYDPEFKEPKNSFIITLNTTNADADRKNALELSKLESKSMTFHGEISGDFKRQNYPTKMELELKIGAQIMMLSNDQAGRWVNGSIGKIKDIKFDEIEEEDLLYIELDNGKNVKVGKFSWNIYKYVWNDQNSKIEAEILGSFTQYPVRLAWAVTIHKSQGKTFENVIIDIGRGTFAHGQIYVALSRCRSFQGITLKKPIRKQHIIMDKRVNAFLEA